MTCRQAAAREDIYAYARDMQTGNDVIVERETQTKRWREEGKERQLYQRSGNRGYIDKVNSDLRQNTATVNMIYDGIGNKPH